MSIFDYLPGTLSDSHQELNKYKRTFSAALNIKNIKYDGADYYGKILYLQQMAGNINQTFRELKKERKAFKKLNWWTDYLFAGQESSARYEQKYKKLEQKIDDGKRSLDLLKYTVVGYVEELHTVPKAEEDRNFFVGLLPRGPLAEFYKLPIKTDKEGALTPQTKIAMQHTVSKEWPAYCKHDVHFCKAVYREELAKEEWAKIESNPCFRMAVYHDELVKGKPNKSKSIKAINEFKQLVDKQYLPAYSHFFLSYKDKDIVSGDYMNSEFLQEIDQVKRIKYLPAVIELARVYYQYLLAEASRDMVKVRQYPAMFRTSEFSEVMTERLLDAEFIHQNESAKKWFKQINDYCTKISKTNNVKRMDASISIMKINQAHEQRADAENNPMVSILLGDEPSTINANSPKPSLPKQKAQEKQSDFDWFISYVMSVFSCFSPVKSHSPTQSAGYQPSIPKGVSQQV